MRFPALTDASQLLKWAGQIAQQHERDFNALKGSQGTVTLTPSSATTTLANAALRPTSVISFEPRTASAAAEKGNGTMYHDTPTQGAVVIHHASNSQTDRVFSFLISGT